MFEQPNLPQALDENNGYLGAGFGLMQCLNKEKLDCFL